jgi:hypothetical protein
MDASPAGKNYKHITPARWKLVKASAAKYGIHIRGDQGKGSAMGAEFSWGYAPTTQTLSIAVTRSLFTSEPEALKIVDLIIQEALQV